MGPVTLRAGNRWEAIDELMDHLVEKRAIKPEDRDAIAASVKVRETSMSTGIGLGIGLPHATTDLVSRVVTVVGHSRNGIPFYDPDRKPVNIVLLFLVPQGAFQKHVTVLADIVKLLHKKEFRDWLESGTR